VLGEALEGKMAEDCMLVTHGNSEEFYHSTSKPLKALLFTKKTETPALWLRVAEALSDRCKFGEVRLEETQLMQDFAMTPEILPKVVAIRQGGIGGKTVESIVYDGPNDFDLICQFLSDALDGGPLLVELKREVETLKREARSLKAELMQKNDALETSRAETARAKLGQVGQVDAVRKMLEGELAELRSREESTAREIEAREKEYAAKLEKAERECEAMSNEVASIKQVHEQAVCELTPDNVDAFLRSTVRPIKAVLATTKTDVPILWKQLADDNSLTTSFGIARHTQESLLTRFGTSVEALPVILFYVNGSQKPTMYDGIVTLEALSSFLRATVEGGTTVMELRTSLDQALMDCEAYRKECERTAEQCEASIREKDKAHREEVKGLEAVVSSLKKQLKDACQGLNNPIS
jgi:hypothetical protein